MDMYQASWWWQNHFGVELQNYAEDAQLFIAWSLRDQSRKVILGVPLFSACMVLLQRSRHEPDPNSTSTFIA
jgi:hypothetical protein